MSVKKVAILVDDLALGSPSQQIVDRFLIGFTRDGVFGRPTFEKIAIWCRASDDKIIEQRRREFPRNFVGSRDEAIANANAVVFIQNEGLSELIEHAPAGAPVFVYGLVANAKKEAEAIINKTENRSIPFCAGSVMSTLQHLPPMDIPTGAGIGAQIREVLIVTQGAAPKAEVDAFDALASILDRHGGVREIRNVRTLEGDAVWEAAGRDWSWRMLASALSRTDKAQGNTLLDGRTEDIVGLGLTQKMAKNPRARIIEHSGGLRTTIMVLDGVVADLLVAVRAGRRLLPGTIYSTQLFQSQTPQQEHFNRLVATISDFFESGKAPWDTKCALVAADLAERLTK
jgi:hypothetical protein